MAGDLRCAGDLITYDNLENADILSVCASAARGLPVALGVLYLDAARRCGLAVQGVDFPGHFLLRDREPTRGRLALDPFCKAGWCCRSELSRRALLAGLTPTSAERIDR